MTASASHTIDATGLDLDVRGTIFDLDTFAVHDGPGIRLAVYLKGCPLACGWCHSPESQRRQPQVVFSRERCALCGGCVAVCEQEVHVILDGEHRVELARCQACGQCVAVCPSGAVSMKGYEVSAREVVRRAERLLPFFRHSGGGVTLTGGEVTMQPDFSEAVLAGCRALGAHTAIETCGATSWATLERLVGHCDLVLYDLKLVDEAEHRRWTGASNRQILENARHLAQGGYNVQVRVPMIPGITDTEHNLSATLDFMQQEGLRSIAFLPYNEAAGAKYEWLGQAYTIEGARQNEEMLQRWVRTARGLGLEADVS